MRRLILVSALAASTAIFGACDPKTEAPNKPAATPATPASSATPATAPSASPVASPAKPGETPKTGDVKKDDANKNVNKETKPAETPKAK